MRTLASVGPARSINEKTRAIAGDSPSIGVSPAGVAIASTFLRSVTTSAREVRKEAAVRTVASSRSFAQGFDTKSVAPRFIASTATPIPA